MKSFLGLLIIVFSIPILSFAAGDFNAVMTAFTARKLSYVKNVTDFEKLKLSETNKNVMKDQRKQFLAAEVPSKITQSGSTTLLLTFGAREISVEFKDIHKNLVWIDGGRIELNAKKTFHNYKNEVQAILSGKKNAFLHLILPEAIAAEKDQAKKDPANFVSWTLSAVNGWIVSARPSDLDNEAVYNSELEEAIIAAQRAELDPRSGGVGFYATTFECEGKRVKSISESAVDSKTGAPIDSISSMTEYLGGRGWSLLSPLLPGNRIADASGIVIESGKPTKNNIFKEAPFYEFPKIAKRCCEKSGCYQKVTSQFKKSVRAAEKVGAQ